MRWNKEDKSLILEVIEKYRKTKTVKQFVENWVVEKCPFCPVYCDYCGCVDCPNERINDILGLCQGMLDLPDSCTISAAHLGIKRTKGRSMLGFVKQRWIIKKRLQFWIDALELTKKQFVKNYKQRGKNERD